MITVIKVLTAWKQLRRDNRWEIIGSWGDGRIEVYLWSGGHQVKGSIDSHVAYYVDEAEPALLKLIEQLIHRLNN